MEKYFKLESGGAEVSQTLSLDTPHNPAWAEESS